MNQSREVLDFLAFLDFIFNRSTHEYFQKEENSFENKDYQEYKRKQSNEA